VGWIYLGDGVPADGIRYRNNSAGDFGVNHDGVGRLYGWAYSANAGWLLFTNRTLSGIPFEGPMVELSSGFLSGHVYGANVGWMSLNVSIGSVGRGRAFVQTKTAGPLPDSDADGLPDPWELSITGNLTTLIGNADADADRLSNASEYLAGTDPNDADSVLRITRVASGTNGEVALEWASRPNRLYSLQRRTTLDSAAHWEKVPGFGPIPASPGSTTSRAFKVAPGQQSFYRIEARLPSFGSLPTIETPCLTPVSSVFVFPDVATDGDRIQLLVSTLPQGSRVVLTGYRYTNQPPTLIFPQGDGRERIFCECVELFSDEIEELGSLYYFFIPMHAPSGEYTVRVFPPNFDCSGPCPEDDCVAPTLFVTPSFIVTTLNRIRFNANSEDPSDHPAEMSFTFASFCGTGVQGDPNSRALVEFSGLYPGGVKESGHLTHADFSTAYPNVPLFIGIERNMTESECTEESESFPPAREAVERQKCRDWQEQRRFTDQFEFSVSGAEFDESPSDVWGYVVAIGSVALRCYVGAQIGAPCADIPSAISLGETIATKVNQALAADDDHLGEVSLPFTGPVWPMGEFEDLKLSGPYKEEDAGDIDITAENHRVGGPRILQWKVALKSLTIDEGYEDEDCDKEMENDVYLHARAFLARDGASEIMATERHPSARNPCSTIRPGETDHWHLRDGETRQFNSCLVLNEGLFDAEGNNAAPESPLIYVEIGVWEHDAGYDGDLMGLHSKTIFLTDLLAGPQGISDEVMDGLFVRKAHRTFTARAHGYTGSDAHCCPPGVACATLPYAEHARVSLTYEVEVTWLKRMSR
jgi:hypothetical protein